MKRLYSVTSDGTMFREYDIIKESRTAYWVSDPAYNATGQREFSKNDGRAFADYRTALGVQQERLEKEIDRHEERLKEMRDALRACENRLTAIGD